MSARYWEISSVVVLAVVLVVGGFFVSAFEASDPDGDELVEDVRDSTDEVETIVGTRSKEIVVWEADGTVSRSSVTEDVWLRPPDQKRSEIVSANDYQDFSAGDVKVINGSTLTWYWAADGRMVIDDEWDPDVGQFDVHQTEVEYETEYLGTETVAGRETRVVEVTIAENSSVQAALTLHVGDSDFDITTVRLDDTDQGNVTHKTTWWVDTETGYPVKERLESRTATGSRVQTTVYEEISFDADISEEKFTVNPPPDTFVYKPPESLNVGTVTEADEAAPFAVPEPPVPDRFELDYVDGSEFKVVNGGEFRGIDASDHRDKVRVRLHYREGDTFQTDDAVWIEITEWPPSHTEEMTVAENIGSVNGTAVDMGRGVTLIYHCGDVRYEITPFVEEEDRIDFAADIAESMGCP